MNDDFEKQFYLLLNKMQTKTNNKNIFNNLSKTIITYFFKQFYVDNYDLNKLNDDIFCLLKNFSNHYYEIDKILSEKEQCFIVAVIANQLEDFLLNNQKNKQL